MKTIKFIGYFTYKALVEVCQLYDGEFVLVLRAIYTGGHLYFKLDIIFLAKALLKQHPKHVFFPAVKETLNIQFPTWELLQGANIDTF